MDTDGLLAHEAALQDLAQARGLRLLRDAEGLALEGGGMTLRGDFARMLRRARPHLVSRELLVKAAKLKGADRPRAVDATAGLGEDSFLLAAAGFEVTMHERDALVAALLADALERARRSPELAGVIERMHLVPGDGLHALASLEQSPDLVYLDPMFPEKGKSASAKKKLQIIQRLESPCADEAALLDAALGAKPRKVVVKRPIKGPFLADRKPACSLRGKAVRFDCYLN